MKRFDWQWLVISSLVSVGLAAVAETRPQYGGTVHVAVYSAMTSLDPADNTQPDSFTRRDITLLIFETLVTTDERGQFRPGLAASWQSLSEHQPEDQQGHHRWEFTLRKNVKFQDGTPLRPEFVASSLRTANPSWNLSTGTDSVIIERDADLNLLAELTLARNAIVKRNSDGTLSGTGTFYVRQWQPGRKLSLAAEENYWGGRTFLDAIEIEMEKNAQDPLRALELGKADLVEVAPEQSHKISTEGRIVASSAPVELLALVFTREAKSSNEDLLRQALALSVERSSMRSVLLQGVGEAAGSILPNWMSGYGFVFPSEADLARARHLREQARPVPTWTLQYDTNDVTGRLLAERIALNARDAALALQPTTTAPADLRLVRIRLATADPFVALRSVAEICGLFRAIVNGSSTEDLYAAERAMLGTRRLIPLLHLPVSFASVPALKGWSLRFDGSWGLADAWLENERP